MRWILMLVSLNSMIFCNAQVQRIWIGDTSKVFINGMDSTCIVKQRIASTDTFIGYYDVLHTSKAFWSYECDTLRRDSSWYPSGKLKSYNIYKNRPGCTYSKAWDADGTLNRCADCTGDTSVIQYFWTNGKLKRIDIGYWNSTMQFTDWRYRVEYFESGRPMYDTCDLRKPIPDGNVYYSSGSIYSHTTVRLQDTTALNEQYFESGQLAEQGHFKISSEPYGYPIKLKVGTWSYYNESGKLIKEEFYEEGKLVKTVEY